jgi:hypothetical protein
LCPSQHLFLHLCSKKSKKSNQKCKIDADVWKVGFMISFAKIYHPIYRVK